MACKMVRYRGHTRRVCRNSKGQITSVGKGRIGKKGSKRALKKGTKCPAKWRGKTVKRSKGGGCYVKMSTGKVRFVKKVARKR